MGAESFVEHARGKTAEAAFEAAVQEALYDYGHAGYTGTIAEKHEFVEIDVPEDKTAEEFVDELMRNDDERIEDKWGPAGCVCADPGPPDDTSEERDFIFFGSASS